MIAAARFTHSRSAVMLGLLLLGACRPSVPAPPDAQKLEIRRTRGESGAWSIGDERVRIDARDPLTRSVDEGGDDDPRHQVHEGETRPTTTIHWGERFDYSVEHPDGHTTSATCRIEAIIVVRRAAPGVLHRDRDMQLMCRIGGAGDLQLDAWLEGDTGTDAAMAHARLVGNWGQTPLATPFGHDPFEAWVGFDGRGDPLFALDPRRRGTLWLGAGVPDRDRRALVVASAALMIARPSVLRVLGDRANDASGEAFD